MPDFIEIEEIKGFTNSSLVTPLNELILTNILAENISTESVGHALEQINYLQFGLGRMLCNAYNITNDLLYQCQSWKEIWSRTDVIESIWNNPILMSILKSQEIPAKYFFASNIATQWIIDKSTDITYLPIVKIKQTKGFKEYISNHLILLTDTSLTNYTIPQNVNNIIVMTIAGGGKGGESVMGEGSSINNSNAKGMQGGDCGGLGGNPYSITGGACGGGGGGTYRIRTIKTTANQIIPVKIAKETTIYTLNGIAESSIFDTESAGITPPKDDRYYFPTVGNGGVSPGSESNNGTSGERFGGKGGNGGVGGDASGAGGGGGYSFKEFIAGQPDGIGGNGGKDASGRSGQNFGAGGGGGSGAYYYYGARNRYGGNGAQGCIALILGGENL